MATRARAPARGARAGGAAIRELARPRRPPRPRRARARTRRRARSRARTRSAGRSRARARRRGRRAGARDRAAPPGRRAAARGAARARARARSRASRPRRPRTAPARRTRPPAARGACGSTSSAPPESDGPAERQVLAHGAKRLELDAASPNARTIAHGSAPANEKRPSAPPELRAVEPPGAGAAVQRVGDGQQRSGRRQLPHRAGDCASPRIGARTATTDGRRPRSTCAASGEIMPAFPAPRRIALPARRTPDGREIAPITLSVHDAGEGPAVVLSHGFPELAWSWRHQFAPLVEAGFRVIAPDQRGYGASDRPEPIEAYDIHHLTGDLVGAARRARRREGGLRRARLGRDGRVVDAGAPPRARGRRGRRQHAEPAARPARRRPR